MLFEAMPDLDCALASEGSYGPIDRVPLTPGGVELLAFVDRKRGIRHVETLPTHRTNWRLQRFAAGDPARLLALKDMGFPGVRRVRGLQQRHEPADQGAGDRRRGDRRDGPRGASLGRRARGALLRHARAQKSAAHEGAARRRLEARQAPGDALPEVPRAGLGLHQFAPRPALRGVRASRRTGSISRSTAAPSAATRRRARARMAAARPRASPARPAADGHQIKASSPLSWRSRGSSCGSSASPRSCGRQRRPRRRHPSRPV